MASIWEFESLVLAKEKLKAILENRKVTTNEEDGLIELIDKVKNIGNDTLMTDFILNKITDYENKKIQIVPAYAFYSKASIVNLRLPNVTSINSYAFYGCRFIEFINYNVGFFSGANSVFYNNSYIKKIIMPFYMSTSDHSFFAYWCTSLEIVDLDSFRFCEQDFNGCRTLKALVLRSKSSCALTNINAFLNTPIRNNIGGYVYVPDILVEQYKKATNWSTIANRITKLEDTIYEDPYWSKKKMISAIVDGLEKELPADTTVLLFKNTFKVDYLYSDGNELENDDLIIDYVDTVLTTEVK